MINNKFIRYKIQNSKFWNQISRLFSFKKMKDLKKLIVKILKKNKLITQYKFKNK